MTKQEAAVLAYIEHLGDQLVNARHLLPALRVLVTSQRDPRSLLPKAARGRYDVLYNQLDLFPLEDT